jgi:peroxiredoxin
LQAVLDQIKAHGASLYALTPHLPANSAKMAEKNELGFDLLTDPGNAFAAELGLRFVVEDPLRSVYAGRGIDLPKFNGDDSWTLPMPARLVVDKNGIVRAADIDPDYTARPEPEKTLADLAALA